MITRQLQQIDIFKDLDEEIMQALAQITTIKSLNKDNMLFFEGEEPKYVYGLIKGHLKLYKTGIKANEIVLHYFTNPGLVAEMTALENINFPVSAVVVQENTQVALIDKEKFLQLLHNDKKFAFTIIRSLSKKIKNLEITINRNLIFDATLKVCSLLKENPDIFLTMKNKEIATLLNMAPETISRILTKLRKLEILDGNNYLKDERKLSLFLDF